MICLSAVSYKKVFKFLTTCDFLSREIPAFQSNILSPSSGVDICGSTFLCNVTPMYLPNYKRSSHKLYHHHHHHRLYKHSCSAVGTHTGWRTKYHTIDCKHNKFLFLKKAVDIWNKINPHKLENCS